MHPGATMVAFRPREPELVIVPWLDGDLLDGSSERLDAFPGLAAWWRRAERLWSDNKTARSNMKLLDRLDYQHLLRRQLPPGRHRVVYSASGQHLAACRIEDDSVIEHKLYWASVESLEEARYLVAILNSQTLKDAVAPLQSRGQHNPRDFDLHVFGLPFPIFDPRAELHAGIAQLAHRAEIAAAGIDLDADWQFQKARRIVREALVEDGIAAEIDAAVRELVDTSRASNVAAPSPTA